MRIAIVGAGPAGLAAAIKLRERGYHDIKVFERADRVGGKAMTVEIDGHHYDLGAVLVTERYPHLLALAKRYDMAMFARSDRRAGVDLKTGRWMNIADAITARHSTRELMTALVRAHRYVYKYRRFFDRPGFAFTSFPDLEHVRQETALPLSEWARATRTEPLLALWEPAIADLGYGPYQSVSAQYILTYLLAQPRDPFGQALWKLARKRRMPLFSFKMGYQALFEHVAGEFNVTTGAMINRIVRKEDCVILHRAGRAEPERFDKVLLAMPLDEAVDLLEDEPPTTLAEESVRIFKRLEYTDYYATIAESSRLFEDAEAHFAFGSQELGLLGGHCSSQPWSDSKLRVFYHYGSPDDPASSDAAVTRLRTDLCDAGISLGSVLYTQQWRYFPRFSCTDIAAGLYDRAEELQGKLNTYFLGSAMAFESVEHTIAYSYWIVEREFADISR